MEKEFFDSSMFASNTEGPWYCYHSVCVGGETLEDAKIQECSNPDRTVEHLLTTYTYPPIYFKSTVDKFYYLIQYNVYVNSFYSVFLGTNDKDKRLYMFSREVFFSSNIIDLWWLNLWMWNTCIWSTDCM